MTETVIHEFKRLKQTPTRDDNIELELRFQDITFSIFSVILAALAKKFSWELEKTVDYRSDNIIRQIEFKGDKKIADRQRKKDVVAKTRISHSVLDYNLTLSLESNTKELVKDSKPIIRIKLRFRFKLNQHWQIHATLVKQLTNVDLVQNTVNEMFKKGEITPENVATKLKLPENAADYRFEIEAELMDTSINITTPDIQAIANSVFETVGTDKTSDIQFQNEVYYIASYIEDNADRLEKFRKQYGLKNLAPPVIPLNKSEYKKIYPPINYFVSDKADGIHSFVTVHDQKCRIIADKYYEFSKSKNALTNVTIVDCELIYDKEQKSSTKRSENADSVLRVVGSLPTNDMQFELLVLDVIQVDGKFVGDKGFEIRYNYFEEACKIISSFGLRIRAKKFLQINNPEPKHIKEQIDKVVNSVDGRSYSIDGIILVEPGQSYKDTKIFKHKSLRDNTIDFLAMKSSEGLPLPKIPDKDIYFLFNGITYDLFNKLGIQFCPGYKQIFDKTDYTVPAKEHLNKHEIQILPNLFPIQFCPSDCPLAYVYFHPKNEPPVHEKIVELRCRGKCAAAGGLEQYPDWELVKIRGERLVELANKRYFGNYFRIAEMTWVNYIDPFPIEQVWLGPSGGYFSEEKSGIYFPQTACTSYIKSKRIETFNKYNLVIDLGGGRGQDLKRYMINKIQKIIIIDKDKSALAELERRKYDIIDSITKKREMSHIETVVRAMWADLNTNFKDIIFRLHRNFPETNNKAGAVISNLAIHYSMNNMEELRNYSSLVQLLTDGTFSITCMLGDRVNKLFKENKTEEGQTWDSYQDHVKKYSLRKLYKGTDLRAIGQKIGVLLPFSSGEYYEENLVNVDTLSAEFKLRGFTLKAVIPFNEHFEAFKRDNPRVYTMLTDEDFKYLSLYGEIIFVKN